MKPSVTLRIYWSASSKEYWLVASAPSWRHTVTRKMGVLSRSSIEVDDIAPIADAIGRELDQLLF